MYKKIKTVEKNGMEIKMVEYQRVYYLMCNDLVVSQSNDFSDMSSLFDRWINTL